MAAWIASGWREPAHADLALCELARLRPDDHGAALAQQRDAACVAGCSHIRTFIAGATTRRPASASAASVRTLSARPCASFASVFAEHGATHHHPRRAGASRCG